MIYGFLFNIINVFKIKELNNKTIEQFSLFLSTLSNDFQTSKTNLIDIHSKKHIACLSYETKACIRNRKFSFADYLLGALTMMSSSIRESEFTLNSFHMNYNSHLGDEFKMTHKCIHKQLDSEESLTLIKALVVQVMSLVSMRLAKQIKAHLMESLKDLLSLLKVKDIVLIDGTELDLRNSCADNFECKGKGRDRLDGSSARPGLKLHVAYSLCKQSFIYVEVSEAVGSERDRVYQEYLQDCLIIADRGYIDEELEQTLIKAGAQFLIKGRANTNGTIIDAYADDGSRMKQYIGKKLKDIPHKMNVDVTIRTSKGNTLRIIRRYNPNGKNRDKISVLRTSIHRKIAGAKQLYLLYRIRWNIELFNKAAKSGCNLKSINSSKKNIILIFILLSLLVSLIKTYCAAKTMIRHKIDDLSLLKVHTYNVLYEKLLFAFAYRNRSTIYQVFKELLGEMALSCKRSKPSQRDRLLIKDLPLLLWQIVNQPGFKRKIS